MTDPVQTAAPATAAPTTTTTQTTTTPSAQSSQTDPAAPAVVTEPAKADAANPEPAKTDGAKDPGDLLFDENKDGEADGEKKDGEEADQAIAVDFEKITLPDGMQISAENKEALSAFIAKYNLPADAAQGAAQELADIGAKMQQAQLDGWMDMKKEWREKVESDPILGGHNLKQTVADANTVVRKYAGDEAQLKEFQQDLVFLGLGNKTSFVRFLANIHAATKEDTLDGRSSAASVASKTAAQRMYPSMKSESDA